MIMCRRLIACTEILFPGWHGVSVQARLRRSLVRSLGVLAVLLSCLSVFAADDALCVICTTTHLSCATKGIGGRHVEVTPLVPFGMCPGHFDITPREAQALGKAELVLAHGYERFLEDVKASNPRIAVTKVGVDGNWMVPEVQKAGARAVTELLCARRPAMAAMFRGNLAVYLRGVDEAAGAEQAKLKRFQGTRVLCSSMNRQFIEWLGFDVLAAFPRDEDISAKALADIVLRAKANSVRLVIDNRQSSGKVGRTFADELGVPLVVLNNFPPDGPGPAAYSRALGENCRKVLKAILGATRK